MSLSFPLLTHSPMAARSLAALLLGGVLAAAPAMAGDPETLSIADPYFRDTLPGQDLTAGFAVIRNSSDKDCALRAASAAGIERLELHEHQHDHDHASGGHGGMMRMRKVVLLPLPAGGTLELSPGGYHLMGFGAQTLTAGDSVDVELDFGDCGTRTVAFAVVDPRR